MRWPAWLRRGEPSGSEAREAIARREGGPDEGGPIGWWFAGGANAGGADLTPGAVHREHGIPVPGQHGLHASASLLDALAHAPGGQLCRVRLGGRVVMAGARLAATERTILASTDATARVRALCARWIERALASAMEETQLSDAAAHRALAQAARERALDAGERLRNAKWVLEEGAGRAEGPARARAMGAQEGARRALREARTAAYAHEAAAQLAEKADLRCAARAIELVIEALVELEPSAAEAAHAAVRARLDRELEQALSAALEARAPEPSRAPDEAIDPCPSAHRGEALMDALERALAAHGVRSMHPLSAPGASVLLRCASKDAAQRALDAIDASPELGALGVRALGVWSASDRSIASIALREPCALDPLRWEASIEEALERPALGRDRDALLRAWLSLEPSVVRAMWIEGEVLALELDGSIQEGRALLSRLAAHHPRGCALSASWTAPLATRAAIERAAPLSAHEESALVYRRNDGLAEPPPGAVPAERPRQRVSAPRPKSWIDAVHALFPDGPRPPVQALGGEPALARHLRRAGVYPVAVFVEPSQDIAAVIARADASAELERLHIGIIALVRCSSDAGQWRTDRRLRRALGKEDTLQLIAQARCAHRQYRPRVSTDEAGIRWHLAAFDEVECAGWLFTPERVLAVLVLYVEGDDRSEALARIEAALAQASPSMKLVLACSCSPEPEAHTIDIVRAAPGVVIEDLPRALAEVFAQPDVYRRDSMLSAPPAASPAWREPLSPRRALPAVRDPSARCPRCEVEYALPSDTPLEQTRCGLCGNACLIPVREPRPPYVAWRPSQLAGARLRARGPSSAALLSGRRSPSPVVSERGAAPLGVPGGGRFTFSQQSFACPSCAHPLALLEPTLHARCPHCKAAVVPIAAED